MPIQFDCPGCHRPIRVPDGTEGKPARCPNCSEVTEIPFTEEPLAEFASADLSPPPELETVNPFQSPTVEAGPAVALPTGLRPGDDGRDGPAWELPGPSLQSFFQTTKDVLLTPQETFRRMICFGGYARPLGYAVLGGVLGGLLSAFWQLLMFLGIGFAAQQAGDNFGPIGLAWFGAVLQQIVAGVIGAIVGAFVGGGIVHLMLLMLSSARRELEATIRVVCYMSGALWVFHAIPVVGPILGVVWALYVEIIGIAEVHEIARGRAALAVLLPLAVCVVVPVLLLILLLGGFMFFASQ